VLIHSCISALTLPFVFLPLSMIPARLLAGGTTALGVVTIALVVVVVVVVGITAQRAAAALGSGLQAPMMTGGSGTDGPHGNMGRFSFMGSWRMSLGHYTLRKALRKATGMAASCMDGRACVYRMVHCNFKQKALLCSCTSTNSMSSYEDTVEVMRLGLY
jgi:hypothetical protein